LECTSSNCQQLSQCASFVEILELSQVVEIEFETAIIQVEVEKIEAVKQIVETGGTKKSMNPQKYHRY
jgi:hypothetical protein